MSVAVIIATYGDRSIWKPLADRAVESVDRQTRQPDEIIVSHGPRLHQARNVALSATSDWLIFLDADDELDEQYIECALRGTGDIRRPSIRSEAGVVNPPGPMPDIRKQNCTVVGAMQRSEYFRMVGGFRDWAILEDWDLWLRMIAVGADVGDAPDAIYWYHHSENGRNTSLDDKEAGSIYREISEASLR